MWKCSLGVYPPVNVCLTRYILCVYYSATVLGVRLSTLGGVLSALGVLLLILGSILYYDPSLLHGEYKYAAYQIVLPPTPWVLYPKTMRGVDIDVPGEAVYAKVLVDIKVKPNTVEANLVCNGEMVAKETIYHRGQLVADGLRPPYRDCILTVGNTGSTVETVDLEIMVYYDTSINPLLEASPRELLYPGAGLAALGAVLLGYAWYRRRRLGRVAVSGFEWS